MRATPPARSAAKRRSSAKTPQARRMLAADLRERADEASVLLHAVVLLHGVVLLHAIVLLHGVLGHAIVLFHRILGHGVFLLHGVALAHLVLGKGRRKREAERNQNGGNAERDTGAGVHRSGRPCLRQLVESDVRRCHARRVWLAVCYPRSARFPPCNELLKGTFAGSVGFRQDWGWT